MTQLDLLTYAARLTDPITSHVAGQHRPARIIDRDRTHATHHRPPTATDRDRAPVQHLGGGVTPTARTLALAWCVVATIAGFAALRIASICDEAQEAQS